MNCIRQDSFVLWLHTMRSYFALFYEIFNAFWWWTQLLLSSHMIKTSQIGHALEILTIQNRILSQHMFAIKFEEFAQFCCVLEWSKWLCWIKMLLSLKDNAVPVFFSCIHFLLYFSIFVRCVLFPWNISVIGKP